MPNVEQFDASRCALCGERNLCAAASGQDIEQCWCRNQPIASETLATIGNELRNRICICSDCATPKRPKNNE